MEYMNRNHRGIEMPKIRKKGITSNKGFWVGHSYLPAQNNFCYTCGFYDIDYTAIPPSWATKAQLMISDVLSKEEGDQQG